LSAATFTISLATFVVTIVSISKASQSQLTVSEENVEQVHAYKEAQAEEAEEAQAEEADDTEATEPQEQLYRLALPSGKEMALKRKGNHMRIGLVDSGNGQVFKVIPLLTGTFAGTIQLHAVGGNDVKGKALDNYHQDNDRLCLYKYCRDNNRAQNWKKDGNKLISMVTGKRAIKENGDSIGFSENGDDITFIPV
jgi:hypothetical protein